MAKKHEQAESQNEPQNAGNTVLVVGKAAGIPIVLVPSDIRSLSHGGKQVPKALTDDVLKDASGEYVFSAMRVVPAVVADVADVSSRDGLHRAIDRLYDSLELMSQANVLELADGRTFERTWRVTSDLSMPKPDSPIEIVGESVTACDPIARYILACAESGHSLAHQRQMQKTLRDAAEKAYIAHYGAWRDDTGTPRSKGKRVL